MARDAQARAQEAGRDARQAFKQGNKFAGDNMGATQQLFGEMKPIYEGEAFNPQGFDPKDLVAMNTASLEGTGGAVSGAVGAGALRGARDRNVGSFAPALDESVREAGRTNATNALDVQQKNAMLREANRQAGISGLQGLENLTAQDTLSSIGLQNQSANAISEAANAETNASKAGWFQNMVALMNALKPTAKGSVGGVEVGIGGGSNG